MKYELDQSETMEQAREIEQIGQLEMEPPKIERAELSEGKEHPPKLDRSDIKLGGPATELMIELKKMQIEQMKEQQAIRNGDIDTKEYWEAKREKIQADQAERNRQQILRRANVNYGSPTTEEGWKAKAAAEFRKSGESSWYNYCMDQAAKCHVNGK